MNQQKMKGKKMKDLQLNLNKHVDLARSYLTSAVDAKNDDLPYWYICFNETPAYARHCRVDDAELVTSWAEGLLHLNQILPTSKYDKILNNWKELMIQGFREDGLRWNIKYPWTETIFVNIHEQGWILSGLVAWYRFVKDEKSKELADNMVKGLRKIASKRKTITFWAGTYPQEVNSWYFLQDSIFEHGWDHSCWTGRGEQELRNAVLVDPLMDWYLLTGNNGALDLAEGLINNTLNESHRFAYDGSFTGHIHSTVWFLTGVAKFAKTTQNSNLLKKCKASFDFVISLSSSFGWIPEYSGWHDPATEHCETCCIKDMIELGLEFANAGYDEYYDLVDRYVRNQLIENQIQTDDIVNEFPETKGEEGYTYKNIKAMVKGGFSGGSEPNNISTSRFRNIAGCCGATGPEALYYYWRDTVVLKNNNLTINFWHNFENENVAIKTDYPNSGKVEINPKLQTDILLRLPTFLDNQVEIYLNNNRVPLMWKDKCLLIENVTSEDLVRVEFSVPETVRKETVMGREITTYWYGNTIYQISPPGNELPLFDRSNDSLAHLKSGALKATK